MGWWFDFSFVFGSFMLGSWKYSTTDIRHETATMRACVLRVCGSVHVCPFSGYGSGGLWDVWSEILNATDFYACTINQLFTISHIWKPFSQPDLLSFSLSLCFPLSSYSVSQCLVLSLPLCVALIHRSHTPVRHIKVIFLEDCRGVDNSDFLCVWVDGDARNGEKCPSCRLKHAWLKMLAFIYLFIISVII